MTHLLYLILKSTPIGLSGRSLHAEADARATLDQLGMLALGGAAWAIAARIKSVVSALDLDIVCNFFLFGVVDGCGLSFAFYDLYPMFTIIRHFEGWKLDSAPTVRHVT